MFLTIEYGSKKYNEFDSVVETIISRLDSSIMGSAKPISNELKRGLKSIALEMEKRHSVPWKAGTTDTTLSKRSGKGIKSLVNSVKVKTANQSELILGSISAAKLSVHETGAVITPKRAKYLTIPTDYALDSRGVPLKKSARQWKNTFVQYSKKGNLLIFQKRSRGSIVPLYILKKRVKIPARLGLGDYFFETTPKLTESIMDIIDNRLESIL